MTLIMKGHKQSQSTKEEVMLNDARGDVDAEGKVETDCERFHVFLGQ